MGNLEENSRNTSDRCPTGEAFIGDLKCRPPISPRSNGCAVTRFDPWHITIGWGKFSVTTLTTSRRSQRNYPRSSRVVVHLFSFFPFKHGREIQAVHLLGHGGKSMKSFEKIYPSITNCTATTCPCHADGTWIDVCGRSAHLGGTCHQVTWRWQIFDLERPQPQLL